MADDKYQLNEEKNVDFVNRNFNRKIELDSKQQTLIEYDIKNVLNVATTFENERQLTNTYRIYGSIEYFSILNGIPTGYTSYLDFFDTQTGITKSFLNDFKVYLVKPYGFYDNNISGQTGFTKLDNNLYIKNFEIITELENFEIFNAGYDKNLFSEQRYSFDFNTDINLTDQYDGLYFPITDLFLYVEYQPKNNGSGDPETMSGKTYDDSGNTIITAFTPVPLNVDDVLTGDVIEYDKNGFKQTVINTQEYYINTPCDSGGTDINIICKYDPYVQIQINVFNDELELVNATGTSYEEISSIPVYATPIDDEGNYVWRDLQQKSFFDPLTGEGTAFPFINQRHYVFDNYMIKVMPDLTDATTNQVFTEIIFANNEILSIQPITKAINFGDPC